MYLYINEPCKMCNHRLYLHVMSNWKYIYIAFNRLSIQHFIAYCLSGIQCPWTLRHQQNRAGGERWPCALLNERGLLRYWVSSVGWWSDCNLESFIVGIILSWIRQYLFKSSVSFKCLCSYSVSILGQWFPKWGSGPSRGSQDNVTM